MDSMPLLRSPDPPSEMTEYTFPPVSPSAATDSPPPESPSASRGRVRETRHNTGRPFSLLPSGSSDLALGRRSNDLELGRSNAASHSPPTMSAFANRTSMSGTKVIPKTWLSFSLTFGLGGVAPFEEGCLRRAEMKIRVNMTTTTLKCSHSRFRRS